MRLTRALAAASAAALAAGLSGCGGSEQAQTPAPSATSSGSDCSSSEVFCVGFVTDVGKVGDGAFNQGSWQAVQEAAQQNGGRADHVETANTADWGANIKRFTDAKYDVVVTVGYLMADATTQAARANPDTTFIGIDQPQARTIDNLAGLVFPEDQSGYAAGYLAGLMTKTNKVGQVLGLEVPPVERYAKGFEAGARAADPDVQVTTTYHPAADKAFADPAWGAATAKKQIAAGADIVFGAGGSTGVGALRQTATTKGAGRSTFCIGADDDLWATTSAVRPCLLTSATKDISKGVGELIAEAKDGSIKGGNVTGEVGLAPYHTFSATVPKEVQNKVSAVSQGLADGSIKTGVSVE